MYPDELLRKIHNKITVPVKVTFFSSFLIGLFAHMFMLTNKLPNYDDVHNTAWFYGTGYESGRFTLSLLGNGMNRMFGNFSSPMFNGIIAIILISLSAVLVVYLFDIKTNFGCFFVGAIMVSFPAVTGTMFFMFTVHYYSFGLLLVAISAVLATRGRYSFVIAPILLAFGIGVYQAYISIPIVLLLMLFLKRCTECTDNKRLIYEAVKYLAVIVLGLAIYLILVHIFLLRIGKELVDYQNLDTMGKIPFKKLLELIGVAYKTYLSFFSTGYKGINSYPIVRLVFMIFHVYLLCSIIIQSIYIIKRNVLCSGHYVGGSSVFRCILIAIGVILFPLGINIIFVMSNNSSVYSIMLLSVVFVYIGVILFMERMPLIVSASSSLKVRVAGCLTYWSLTLCLLIIVFSQCHYSNMQYLAMHMQYQQAYSYFTSMVTEIRMTEGYSDTLPLVLIGDRIEDMSFYTNDIVPDTLSGRDTTLLNSYSRSKFLEQYLGFQQRIEQDTTYWEKLPDVQSMPSYPDYGAIRVLDGAIIVKLK